MPTTSPDIALIGAGRWGRHLVRNLTDLGRLAVVVDTDPDALARVTRRHPGVATLASLDAALALPQVRAVALATPTPLHHPMARAALEASRHVFVEKPMTLSLAHAEELTRLAEAHDLLLFTGHQLEYHPAFVALARHADAGHLGEVRHVACDRVALGRPREAASALWDLAAHDVGVAITLMGEPPRQVSATQGGWLEPARVVEATCALSFSGGRRAVSRVSWLHPTKAQRLTVVGTRATAVFDDVAAQDAKLTRYAHAPGGDGPATPEPLPYAWREPLLAECEAFIAAIDGDRSAARTGRRYGRAVVAALDAAERSARRGGAPVALDL